MRMHQGGKLSLRNNFNPALLRRKAHTIPDSDTVMGVEKTQPKKRVRCPKNLTDEFLTFLDTYPGV